MGRTMMRPSLPLSISHLSPAPANRIRHQALSEQRIERSSEVEVRISRKSSLECLCQWLAPDTRRAECPCADLKHAERDLIVAAADLQVCCTNLEADRRAGIGIRLIGTPDAIDW